MARSGLAVVIPAHNEAETITGVVTEATAHGTVIVVDDASSDDTAVRARAAGARVLGNPTNLGYDGSLSRGVEEASRLGFAAVVTMDADGEHDPRLLATFSRLLLEERVPLVLGYRPRKQRFAERMIGAYLKRRYGILDMLCGMKGFRLTLLEENGRFDHVQGINSELALNAVRRGHPFRQIPVSGRPRQDRPRFGSLIKGNWKIFKGLLRVLQFSYQKGSHG